MAELAARILGVEEAPRSFVGFDEFERMAEAGLFEGREKRVELLLGRLVEMAPISGMHSVACARLYRALDRALASVASKLEALPATTLKMEMSGPQPDLILAPSGGPAEKYFRPEEIKLAAEVAVSSLTIDLGMKQKLYASAGIPEYWVVDVHARVLHRLSEPGETGFYAKAEVLEADESVSPACAPEVSIAIKDLF